MFKALKHELSASGSTLIVVSKTRPVEAIQAIYDQGHLDFGENKVQELTEKVPALASDIRWHVIGHLQRNKVKYIAEFVHLIHSVDSFKLLKTIDKEAQKCNRKINCLIQIKIAKEDSKYGFDAKEVLDLLNQGAIQSLENIRICGFMGMATFTDDQDQVREEFEGLKQLFDQVKTDFFADQDAFETLSMGMSGDYKIAIEAGSNMVRVGSLIFGPRVY